MESTIKTVKDILDRQSRPQRHSTWTPKKRDWRYATGVFRHDDFEGALKQYTTWDKMDSDYHSINSTRGKRGSPNKRASSTSSGCASELGTDEMPWGVGTPSSGRSNTIRSPITNGQSWPKGASPLRKSAWTSMTQYRQEGAITEGSSPVYEPIGLTVRLRFTGARALALQQVLDDTQLPATPRSLASAKQPSTPQSVTMPRRSAWPATAPTATTVYALHMLEVIESIYKVPFYQRDWEDVTRDFNSKTVRSNLRDTGEAGVSFGPKQHWYADAVPVDAIFPPGVPISAKEIMAYYPHHVRWKGVMLRLTRNNFRGGDIMGMQGFFRGPPTHDISAAQMNTYQRDTVKGSLKSFKTVDYEGKADRNLYTEDLALGHTLHNVRGNQTLPTFDDLLRGLQHLPTGSDARDLTQCLHWYKLNRDTFSPPLEYNVLHTQSLIRALRQPLRPIGPQNLDRNALREWQDNGRFEECKVLVKVREPALIVNEEQRRSQLHLDLDTEDVSLGLTLPVRHVLTLPFMALHSILGEALKAGIQKAKSRRAAREAVVEPQEMPAAASVHSNKNQPHPSAEHEDAADAVQTPEDKQKPGAKLNLDTKPAYRIPKRQRSPTASRDLDHPAKRIAATQPVCQDAADAVQTPEDKEDHSTKPKVDTKPPYRTSKRQRSPTASQASDRPAKRIAATPPVHLRDPPRPRQPVRPSAYGYGDGYGNGYGYGYDPRAHARRDWNATAPRSSYVYEQPPRDTEYGRREDGSRSHDRQYYSRPNDQTGYARPNNQRHYSRPNDQNYYSRPNDQNHYSQPHNYHHSATEPHARPHRGPEDYDYTQERHRGYDREWSRYEDGYRRRR